MITKAFYSIVQYCPDRFRAETVNVGLVLLCMDPHVVHVKVTDNYDRVCRLFAISEPDLKNLKMAVCSFMNSVSELRTLEDFVVFADSRANDLRLTRPRLAKLDDIDEDFERLFVQLV